MPVSRKFKRIRGGKKSSRRLRKISRKVGGKVRGKISRKVGGRARRKTSRKGGGLDDKADPQGVATARIWRGNAAARAENYQRTVDVPNRRESFFFAPLNEINAADYVVYHVKAQLTLNEGGLGGSTAVLHLGWEVAGEVIHSLIDDLSPLAAPSAVSSELFHVARVGREVVRKVANQWYNNNLVISNVREVPTLNTPPSIADALTPKRLHLVQKYMEQRTREETGVAGGAPLSMLEQWWEKADALREFAAYKKQQEKMMRRRKEEEARERELAQEEEAALLAEVAAAWGGLSKSIEEEYYSTRLDDLSFHDGWINYVFYALDSSESENDWRALLKSLNTFDLQDLKDMLREEAVGPAFKKRMLEKKEVDEAGLRAVGFVVDGAAASAEDALINIVINNLRKVAEKAPPSLGLWRKGEGGLNRTFGEVQEAVDVVVPESL